MAKNYFQDSDIINYTTTADIKSGDVVIKDNLIGIAITDILTGETGAIQRTGVWTLPKTLTNTFTQGANVYWDTTNKKATSVSTGNTLIGFACSSSASGDTSINVVLKN